MNNFVNYWTTRFKDFGESYTGHQGMTDEENAKIYADRLKWMKPKLKKQSDLHTIDFGSGVEKYRPLFKYYVGVDVVQATQDTVVIPDGLLYPVEADHIFCANVLQHHDDKSAANVVKSWVNAEGLKFVTLYEWTGGVKTQTHCWTRTVDEYNKLISSHFEIKDIKVSSHEVHGEKFSLIRYELC